MPTPIVQVAPPVNVPKIHRTVVAHDSAGRISSLDRFEVDPERLALEDELNQHLAAIGQLMLDHKIDELHKSGDGGDFTYTPQEGVAQDAADGFASVVFPAIKQLNAFANRNDFDIETVNLAIVPEGVRTQAKLTPKE